MVGLTHESIIWLMFFKYRFHKIIPYFHGSKQDFENSCKDVFKIKKNTFNGIVVNKLEIVNLTYLLKFFYLFN